MKPLKYKLKITLLCFLSLLLLTSLSLRSHFRGKKRCIVVGAKNCTEQNILGEILASLIEKKTDLKVIRRFNLEGTTICFNAINTGAIDTYFEYTGTALLDILKESRFVDPLFPYVKKQFEDKFQITWLDCLGFSNQYVLIVNSNSSLRNISDILLYPHLQIAFDPEFTARLESRLLKETYSLSQETKIMDQVLLYFSLMKGGVDVISGFSTDGRLCDHSFSVLKDDRRCFPKYEIAPIIRMESLEKYPELTSVFSLLKDKISEKQMLKLNHQVEFLGRDVKEVSEEFIAKRIDL